LGLPVLSCSQLSNQVKTLLFTFKHHILHGTTSNESLKENDGTTTLVISLVTGLLTIVGLVNRGGGTHFKVAHDVLLLSLVRIIFLILNGLNKQLRSVQSRHMLNLFACQLLLELEFDFTHIYA
jgi:hypothetical protein